MITQAAIPPQKADPKGSFMPTLAKLKSARDTANISHKYIRDLMEEYVSNIVLAMDRSIYPTDDESSRTWLTFPIPSPFHWTLQVVNITKTAASEKDVAIQYKLHHLNLDYPLHAEANGSFDPSETEPTEAQFLRILDTLSIIHHLVESQGKRLSFRKYNSTFAFAKDKILQNRACVLEILGRDDSTVGMPGYKYNKYHDFLEYGVLQEAEKILILLEHKYSHMLKIWMDSGNP